MPFANGFINFARKHKTVLIAGTAATVSGIAAPLVIPAAVGAFGFGAGGIAAGSTAAWLMSLGGGVTPAAVAVMQSIGATGAISVSTSVITGGVSGLVAGWFTETKSQNEKESQTNEEEANAQNEDEINEAEEEEAEKSNKMEEEEDAKKDNVTSEDKTTSC